MKEDDFFMKIFADNLKGCLAEIGWTQKELAEKLGTTQRTISHWCNGYTVPDLMTFLQLCLLLGESPDNMLGYWDFRAEID